MTNTIHPTDAIVGERIRARRRVLSVTQEELAKAVGVSFQQVQKYESGHNRVSASRLQEIANVLKAPVSFFFGDVVAPAGEDDPMQRTEAIRLVRNFYKLPEKQRAHVFSLVEAM